jgi:hypothetical protein
MKAKTFENLIRKVVREEIDYALRREIKSLKEDLRDEIKPQIIENTQPLNTTSIESNSYLKEKIMGKSPIKKYEEKSFAKNTTLNDLLNETAQGDTNLNSGNSPVSLSEGFTSLETETQGMPESVANAVTRDYSDLMKAIDNRKK